MTLTAKAPAVTSAPASPTSSGSGGSATSGGLGSGNGKEGTKAESTMAGPPEWDPNNPMNRTFGASGKKGVREGLPGFGGGSGGTSSEYKLSNLWWRLMS